MAPGVISPATINLHRHHSSPLTTTVPSQFPMIRFPSCNFSTNHATTSAFRSSLLPPRNFSLWRARCGATNSRPPSPPKSEPPAEEDLSSSSSSSSSPGLVATFSRFQESLRIFIAVFFWISLFFWSSVWDGRNNGRSDKGPRFRK